MRDLKSRQIIPGPPAKVPCRHKGKVTPMKSLVVSVALIALGSPALAAPRKSLLIKTADLESTLLQMPSASGMLRIVAGAR